MALESPTQHASTPRWRRWLGFAPPSRSPRAAARRRPAHPPLWIRAFTTGGRPLVAVIVLVMCAPGEHHLAKLAGWNDILAWGMAAVLAAYAGIAAAVAGARKEGDPGFITARVGAVVALVLAMIAQAVSHLFTTGWLSAEPRAPWVLVVAVSCTPPLVLGHLLHLAAQPVPVSEPTVPPLAPGVPPGLLTTRELADRLGITASAVSSRVGRGTLVPYTKVAELGNLFDPDDLTQEKREREDEEVQRETVTS
ncbi:hypothetical protein [Streptomyces sp. NPDC056264]|uniref:hypothetical protein n=1 Tax=Streptomyces sp. NPDC056264 TaxID=3345767 RepID=UPI003AAAB464